MFEIVGEGFNKQVFTSDFSGGAWSVEPARAGAGSFPEVFTDAGGSWHMAWCGSGMRLRYQASGGSIEQIDLYGNLVYAHQPVYLRDPIQLSVINTAILQSIQPGKFHPKEKTIPYCGNQFNSLIYMPKTIHTPASPNAGYDMINELVKSARYEVFFATMEYQLDANAGSPGYVLSEAVVDLYNQLKADPQRYPQGLTVRKILDNYPSVSSFEWGAQIFTVLDNLRKAGLPNLENPELGLKLEIANFDGQLPHSHSKFIVVDGKTAASTGYNYSYMHYPEDHPSGQGAGLVDLDLQLKGPAAQDVMRAYEDMWDGAKREELTRRGLNTFVEIHYYEGRMHSKTISIEDELLVVGSQNFHYSAWGEGSLTEYNLTTDDTAAIQAFNETFEYYWKNAAPVLFSEGVQIE